MAIPSYANEAILKCCNDSKIIKELSLNVPEEDRMTLVLSFIDSLNIYEQLKFLADLQMICHTHNLISFIDFNKDAVIVKMQYTISPEEQAQIEQYEKDLEEKYHADILSTLNDPNIS